MKALLDTSILIAALVESHAAHALAFAWLQRIQRREVTGVVAAHTLAELYFVLTRTPFQPPVSSAKAWQMIQTDILAHMQVVTLSSEDYQSVVEQLAAQNIGGGRIYDALIAKAALLSDVDHLVTLNGRHFRGLFPGLDGRIIDPGVTPSTTTSP